MQSKNKTIETEKKRKRGEMITKTSKRIFFVVFVQQKQKKRSLKAKFESKYDDANSNLFLKIALVLR